jgi:hypothetical protein
VITTTTNGINVIVGAPDTKGLVITKPSTIGVTVGTPGKVGPPGPEGGTPVVALPYDQWPPVDPDPDTLYLRLAP